MNMVRHPAGQILKSVPHPQFVISMNRLGEAGHLRTSRMMLAFVPLESRIAGTAHQAFFAGEVSGEALRQAP
jgi:hypothetical protein